MIDGRGRDGRRRTIGQAGRRHRLGEGDARRRDGHWLGSGEELTDGARSAVVQPDA